MTPAGAGVGRLRILRVADVHSDRPGGVARVIESTSAILTARGHHVEHRWAQDMPLPGPQSMRRILVPVAIALHVLRLVARGEAPDVVEVHEPLGAPYALLRALGPRGRLPPLVLFSHGLEERSWRAQKDRWRRLGRRGSLRSRMLVPLTLVAQAKLALRFADRVIVLSSEDRDHLMRARRVRSGRVHRIDNGVDEDMLALRRAAPAADGSVALLFIGTWIDRKGTPELAHAFARLAAEHPDVSLVVAGAGCGVREVLAGFPPSARARVQVHPSVTRGELARLLQRADVFVLPSWFEGMPLSLLEALAAGLPAVASATCGMLDVIRPEAPERDGGRLVRPHDAADLHRALDQLVRDPGLRSRLGERARERASELTWARSAEALESIYRLAAIPGSRRRPVGRRA